MREDLEGEFDQPLAITHPAINNDPSQVPPQSGLGHHPPPIPRFGLTADMDNQHIANRSLVDRPVEPEIVPWGGLDGKGPSTEAECSVQWLDQRWQGTELARRFV